MIGARSESAELDRDVRRRFLLGVGAREERRDRDFLSSPSSNEDSGEAGIGSKSDSEPLIVGYVAC